MAKTRSSHTQCRDAASSAARVPSGSRFVLGRTVATPGALQALVDSGQGPLRFLIRHAVGDWGELGEDDWQANEEALRDGLRIFSAYITARGTRLWIITEADRSATTILLPAEY